ncbi:MAG: FAD-binding oxidoreductase [Chloroflexi bacterium]|nr:MAG: FAD-binding oxidoreductase [Chloroflexota bacterium]
MHQSILKALVEIAGEGNVSQSEADREQHSRDQSAHAAHLPEVVVWPGSTEEVSRILQLAYEYKIPVTGWGAGSSLEGNPIPVHGGIVLDFRRMNRILAVHEADFQVTVEAGVLYKDMNRYLSRFGLFFAPDPGANASIGGMIANNAAGIRTVKYGATRDNVLALTVVLANGRILRTGSRSVKQSSGYDLTHLFTGSEGTLGLITEATLKLAPIPTHISAATAVFPTVQKAAKAVFHLIGSGLQPSALELLDKSSIRILNTSTDLNLPEAPTLLMEFNSATTESLRTELALVEEICQGFECSNFQSGLGMKARNQLWTARHHLFEAMVRYFPGCTWLVTDVAVPISQYPELVAFAAELLPKLNLDGGLVGHAGDGNLHVTVFYPPDDQTAVTNAAYLNEQLVNKAIALDGTSTGEHGVGLGKKQFMVQEHGETAVTLMRQIKHLLDPHNILNPGKIF